jgi:hypothetical protein
LRDGPERVKICRGVTVQLVGIAHNMTWYVPRQPLAWTLEDLPQSDLCQAKMKLTVFFCDTALRTRRAGKEGQRRDDGIGWDDGVIRNLCTILDDCKFSLRKQKRIRIHEKVRSGGCKRRAYSR